MGIGALAIPLGARAIGRGYGYSVEGVVYGNRGAKREKPLGVGALCRGGGYRVGVRPDLVTRFVYSPSLVAQPSTRIYPIPSIVAV
jgi:hypothetical protein